MIRTVLGVALALTVGTAGGSVFAQDADAGKKVFRRCQACHKVEDGKNGVGPHLAGLAGREVASVDGYKYSDAMVEWGSGKVWDDATLAAYLADPKGVVKGTKMAFAGLKKEAQIADVIAYLKGAGS